MLPVTSNPPSLRKIPGAIEETGLSFGTVMDLVLKHAFFEGTATLGMLVDRTKLSPSIIHALYRHFQKEQLCDTRSMVGEDYEISLTAKGRSMADVALKKSLYVGAAPIPLAEYNRVISEQGIHFSATPERLKAAFADLILSDRVSRDLGAALATGGTILLHGSTGNGKTSIGERLHRIFSDPVYVPHAVAVSGQIIAVFDPMIHRPEVDQPEDSDPRWVLCSRPMLKVGGELHAEMLQARMDEITRICVGPVQMKANNGILLIDDFGRQRINARELLNRWIVPLDRRTDVLSLPGGTSFEIPFELLVVFATNLNLSELAEDAFMRRLKNKIKIGVLSEDLFRDLFRRVCKEQNLGYTLESMDYVVQQFKRHSPEGLRACFPSDLVRIIQGIARYEQRHPQLSQEDADQAMRLYFGG